MNPDRRKTERLEGRLREIASAWADELAGVQNLTRESGSFLEKTPLDQMAKIAEKLSFFALQTLFSGSEIISIEKSDKNRDMLEGADFIIKIKNTSTNEIFTYHIDVTISEKNLGFKMKAAEDQKSYMFRNFCYVPVYIPLDVFDEQTALGILSGETLLTDTTQQTNIDYLQWLSTCIIIPQIRKYAEMIKESLLTNTKASEVKIKNTLVLNALINKLAPYDKLESYDVPDQSD